MIIINRSCNTSIREIDPKEDWDQSSYLTLIKYVYLNKVNNKYSNQISVHVTFMLFECTFSIEMERKYIPH